jgi:hypothetical protein
VSSTAEDIALLSAQMMDTEAQWSLGTFGALAEFTRDRDEEAELLCSGPVLSAATQRGAIRITPLPDMRLIASETTTKESWSHRIALCLPVDSCAMNRRAVLTELGPDKEALRAEDRGAILFDLGFDAPQVDLCIRLSDPQIVAQLRDRCGRPVFEHGNPAMGIVLAENPHRVFMSRLGRIEVFQPIPPANGKSPEGPHTHVLPKLLHHKRTHPATEPIPEGWVPCAHLYPAHPAKDGMGRALPFDRARHEAFQAMLRQYGDSKTVDFKQQVLAAIIAGKDPAAIKLTDNRFARTNVRVALRQLRVSVEPSPALMAWVDAHERSNFPSLEDEDDPYDHV